MRNPIQLKDVPSTYACKRAFFYDVCDQDNKNNSWLSEYLMLNQMNDKKNKPLHLHTQKKH